MSGGWNAIISSPSLAGENTKRSYIIAIAERDAAERALQRKLSSAQERIEMVNQVPADILDEFGLKTGTIWGLF